jgi:hypothetical protein
MRAASRNNIKPVGTNSILRHEPTWGDTSKLVDVVHKLNPANASNLVAFFAGGLSGPRHCQLTRNACAHVNRETLQEVLAMAVDYEAFSIRHPIQALHWRIPRDGTPAFLAWIEDMRDIARGVTQ